jgi:hypothetical protein
VPERLTESLIQKGVLTRDRAGEALERQVLQGGAIDTSLLELELVSERDLVEAMALAYTLEAAAPDRASLAPDPKALRVFPEQWAKKHQLAPLAFDEENRSLAILTPAPADLNLISRLGELLEIDIEPLLAPEFRVAQRLEFLYETEANERLSALIEKLGATTFEAIPRRVGPPPLPKKEPVPQPPPAELAPLPFGDAINALREAKHRDEIAETTLRHAANDLELAALFIVHADHVEGWMGLGPGSEKVPKLPIPLKADSAFRVVLDTQAHYLGPLPSDPLHVEFLERLGRPEPRTVLIVPIRIKSRTVALLYGENGNGTIAPRLAADLMLFTTHVQSALEGLLIRKKAETISDLSSRPQPAAAFGHEPSRPVQVAQLSKLATIESTPAFTPVPPMEELRGFDSTEYAYVRKKPDFEDSPETTIDELVAEDSKPAESTDALAASFAPQAEEPALPEPAPTEEDEDDGWDSVDIAGGANADEPIEPVAQTEDVNLAEAMVAEQAEAMVAEQADGSALLDELRELETLRTASDSDVEEGWDEVPVQPWDEFGAARDPAEAEKWIERGHRELLAMRESLGEDQTVPDLSAEAWIRASSDVVRPRPVSAEVRNLAARPEEEPLLYRGVVLNAEDFEGESLEPVPLTQRTSSSMIDPNTASTTPDIEAHHITAVDKQGNVVSRGAAPAASQQNTELDALVEAVISANREDRKNAKEKLKTMGSVILPRIAEVFPGVVEVDPFSAASPLPPFADCGVLPSLMAHFAAEAHPHLVRRLDAPEPVRRFFTVYFYSAVFVPEAIPKLIQRLHDEETRVSLLAARTLFSYREHAEFGRVLDHLHGRLEANSITARRHATYLIGLFRDVTAIPKLIDVFDKKDKAMFEVAEDALAEITKQRLGSNAKKWRAWWGKNHDKSRIVWLIDGLGAKDAALRKSAAEELRAVTGVDTGYDDDAPKRQREESRQRWLDWWNKQNGGRASI